MIISKIEGIIFDLDGTLIDSQKDIAMNVNRTREHFGKPRLPFEQIYPFIGRGVPSLIKDTFEDAPDLPMNEAISLFMRYYKKHLMDHSRLYPGAMEVLEYYRSLPSAIVSNKPLEYTHIVLNTLKIHPYFMSVLGPESLLNSKPHPEPFLKSCKTMRVNPERTLVVGDSHIDIECARQIKAFSCFCAFGIGSLSCIQPTRIVHSLKDIIRYFPV